MTSHPYSKEEREKILEKIKQTNLERYGTEYYTQTDENKSKFVGEVYEKLGFNIKSLGKPSKHWYNPKSEKHFTDSLIRQRGVDQLLGISFGKGASNEQLLIDMGFLTIFNCGQSSYVIEFNRA